MPASSPQHDDAQYEDALWKLVLYDDTGAPEIISVSGDKFTVGREADNDLALDDLQISRRHLEFTRRDGGLIVEDLHTINGTLLNDEPLAEPRALQPGDLIQIGSIKIRVEGPAQTLPQARVQTQVHAAPAAAAIKTKKRGAKRRLFWLVSAGIILLLVAIGLIGLFGLNWFFSDGVPIVMGQPTRSPGSLDVPKVTINQGPTERSLIRVNQSVTIQAIASDPGGVTRIELWVNNRKVDEIASQLAQNVFSMTAGFQWSADSPGSYTLQVRAYNRKGLAGVAPVMTLTVVDSLATLTPEPPPTPTPLPSPTPTFTPLPPTPTLSPTPTITLTPGPTPVPPASLVINPAALNVRAGPGTPYEVVGRIDRSNQVEIIGQADLGWGVWWQIPFPAAPGGVGWVSAHSRFTTAANADDVPRIVPLLPTPTATHTPTTPPPTATPTATPVVIRAPEGKTLLIIGNRSLGNQPVRLTLSGGKSVGGGQEIDPPPNQEIQLVLEPDFYRALWSAPSNGFARSFDFTAIPGKVMVMWVVPEQDLAETEIYDELIVNNLDE